MKHLIASTLGLAALLSAQSSFGAGPPSDSVEVPVQKGENLMTALKRVHPCFDNPGVKVPMQILTDNPEKSSRDGTMILAHSTLKLPASFMDAKTQCHTPERTPTAETSAEAPAEGGEHVRMLRKGPELPPPGAHEDFRGDKEARAEARKEEEGEHSAHEPHEHEGPKARNHVTVFGEIDLARLAPTLYANNTRPVFISNAQPGFEIVYSHDISHSFSLGLSYAFLKTSLQEQEAFPAKELSTVASEIAINLTYKISHHSRLSLSLGAAQVDQLAYNADDGEITIDHTFRGTGSFIFWQELANFSGYELIGAIGGQIFVPTRWATSSVGVGQLYKLLVEKEFTHTFGVEAGILGAYERQETVDESHSEFSLAFGAGVTFKF